MPGWINKAQAGIKIPKRNINNLSYADDTTLMTENEKKLTSLLMRVKEETEKAGLTLNNQKTKIMASSSIISWARVSRRPPTKTSRVLLQRVSRS